MEPAEAQVNSNKFRKLYKIEFKGSSANLVEFGENGPVSEDVQQNNGSFSALQGASEKLRKVHRTLGKFSEFIGSAEGRKAREREL